MAALAVSLSLVAMSMVAAASPEDAVFTPGQPMYDTRGKRMYVGGANMFEENGVYYLIGEGEKVLSDCSECFQLYSSTDLAAWNYVGCALNNSDIVAPQKGQPYYRMERPKIFKCPGTGKYMMWFHCDTPNFSMRSVGVLSAPAVTGPYTFESPCFRPDNRDSYDMGTFVDVKGDGKAYLIRSVENKFAGISAMNNECTDTTGIVSQGPDMEGQALMRDVATGTLYAMGSHLTGWAPNPMQFVATTSATLDGAEWVNNTNPTRDSTSFGTQSTFIFPFTHTDGHVTYVAMLDAWNMGPDGPHHKPGGLANMTNVWLPMIPPSTSPTPPNVTVGTPLELADCSGDKAGQQFQITAAGAMIHVATGFCVQDEGADGQLTLENCNGAANQKWSLASGGSTITNGQSGASCVDFNNANQVVDVGNPVITYPCGSPPAWNEKWSTPGVGVEGQVEALDSSGSRTGHCVAPQGATDGWTIDWHDSWSLKDY